LKIFTKSLPIIRFDLELYQMKIAILSPPWIAIPPEGYGGVEKVVADLTENLVQMGHQVMLFATGDSRTKANLRYEFEKALGNNLFLKNNIYIYLQHLHQFFKIINQEKFDIIHNHMQYAAQYLLDLQTTPFVHTLHGAFYKNLKAPSGFIEEKIETLLRFKHHPYISISNNQRMDLPQLNYIKTIYNGINPQDFKPVTKKKNYLAWIGRITYNKGVDIAIKVAAKAGIPLKIAAFIDKGDFEYFNNKIKPLIKETKTEFVDEIKDKKVKNQFLGEAIATLFPIRWHEPFGIVMIESMACGTPVVAFNKGSVSEVIEDKKTGFIVENEDQMITALKKISTIDPLYCHQYAITNFSTQKMTKDYLEAYQIVINKFKNNEK